ncbi:LLM class oxidoreductase [Thiomicrorhabdus lithotrophica]|uniref:LLM class oxidoreductase n=1 Tax=Thiomicrorhabdus lithotrophica TaxID=2949997 RepID=A0ABY8CAN6_9GAMM|nr:LLM class oxidoreductase [Thiomicrorhabdus lithotrophica]WEJ63041.1 LLM class oxidoreductase [Thiomicrorhabdus lithotrophica]
MTSHMAPQGIHNAFPTLNRGYNNSFKPGRLSLGITVPIENYSTHAVPCMNEHLKRAQLVEQLGFSTLWIRDVPFNVPSFGDAGQIFDPFVYLGLLSGQTETISLGVASLVLPLRHPAHVAKAAASIDALSGGRLILGVASGDRPDEYPALNLQFENRSERFRESFEYIQQMGHNRPVFKNRYGSLDGQVDMLPKPTADQLPLLITGGSQQTPDWIAQNGHGWITYPRNIITQATIIDSWRSRIKAYGGFNKPAVQSLYIDIMDDPNAPLEPIHLGYRLGINPLKSHLKDLQSIGINHVAINLRFNQADTETTLKRLADELLPDFA